jgi:hypothetical protein
LSCPICNKRKAERFCPAKAEKICAVCCGREREVSIDCPSDCTYLIAAHRYEDQHERSLPSGTPLLEARIPGGVIHEHQQLMTAVAFTAAKLCTAHPAASDEDVLAALKALAETYKTLGSGILYEQPPTLLVQKELYAEIAEFLAEIKQKAAASGHTPPKDGDIFHLLVFLYRMGLLRTNGRPRARRFIEFLRGQFPQAAELKREESRIIVP